MGKGARNRKKREQKREEQAARGARGGGLFGLQPQGGPFGAAPPWKQPSTVDEAIDAMKQFMESMPRLIVCGRLGLKPLTETQRRELLAGVNLYNAVETVADLQSRWVVAFTTTQRPDLVEAEFLAGGNGDACKRARRRVTEHHDLLVSPRATAQLHREIIENASTDEAARSIDRNTLVHILLSITSEQNGSDEFAGDMPTPDEMAKLQRRIPQMGMEEMLEYAQKLIPDGVASNLFNMPQKYEVLLSNTYDLWFAPWAERSKTTGLGTTPAEAFQIGTGVELLDLLRLGTVSSSAAPLSTGSGSIARN